MAKKNLTFASQADLDAYVNGRIEQAKGKVAKGSKGSKGKGAAQSNEFKNRQLALGNLKLRRPEMRGIATQDAIAFGLMTAEGEEGPKFGKPKVEAKALEATKARSAGRKAAPAAEPSKAKARKAGKAAKGTTPQHKGDQVAAKAGGTLSRRQWDDTLMAKVRFSALVVGKGKKARSLASVVRTEAVWAVVAKMRTDGYTPNEAFADVVEATKAHAKA